MNYIQLLILNGQYKEAKERIFLMLEKYDNRILDIGYGDISYCLTCIRILLSMYVYMLKRGKDRSWERSNDAKLLLERIMRCKTIERELKSFLGKYKDEEMDSYYYKQAHRRLTVLELREKNGRINKTDYERKKKKCSLELEQYEPGLCKRNPFRGSIRVVKFEEIKVPHNTVCIEYFAYYDFLLNTSMLETNREENVEYSYLAFVLSDDMGQSQIVDVIDISTDNILDEKAECLLNAIQVMEECEENEVDEAEVEGAVEYLKQVFAKPVRKYLQRYKKIYIALEFIMQYLPTDLLFCDSKGEPLDIILVDSVCDVEENCTINIEESNALVIGNPQVNLQDDAFKRLPCGELESVIIAGMLETTAYTGKDAKQRVLWEKKQKDVIHIAAHGKLMGEKTDELLNKNLLVNSCLMLAGYKDWEEGRTDKEYGNGIISGDDFLFMNLSQTKLVTLSACMSALGYIKGLDSVHGMRWAIGAAGAENTITTLWSVEDAASAILMILFYRNLRSMSIDKALYEAKKRLRTITAGELKRDDELKQIIEIGWKDNKNKKITADDESPYKHWINWAAYVYYHRA